MLRSAVAPAGAQDVWGTVAKQSREQWRSRSGFLLAAVGSAVGLGNMWRFSYLASEKGGAGFVGLYLLFTLLIGLRSRIMVVRRGAGWAPYSWPRVS